MIFYVYLLAQIIWSEAPEIYKTSSISSLHWCGAWDDTFGGKFSSWSWGKETDFCWSQKGTQVISSSLPDSQLEVAPEYKPSHQWLLLHIKTHFLDYFKLWMVYAGITRHRKAFKLRTEQILSSWESQWPKSVVGTDGGEQLILLYMYTPKQTGGRWKGCSARSLLRDTSITWPDTFFCEK